MVFVFVFETSASHGRYAFDEILIFIKYLVLLSLSLSLRLRNPTIPCNMLNMNSQESVCLVWSSFCSAAYWEPQVYSKIWNVLNHKESCFIHSCHNFGYTCSELTCIASVGQVDTVEIPERVDPKIS